MPAIASRLHRFALAVFVCSPLLLPAQNQPADLLLLHGRILTVDARDSIVQALAVKQGTIVRAGTDQDILAFAGSNPGVRIIDLHGRTATPGLIDTHAHIAEGGTDELYGVALSDASSISEIVDRVRKKASNSKPGEWITGAGWDEGKLAERRYITAADLDAAAPHNPVWLTHTTGHYGAANSLALNQADINAATPDPSAGTIDRDASGKPTGVLKEQSAMQLVTHLIPPRSLEQLRSGILHIQDVLHSEGMTGVKDPLIQPIHWQAYKSLLEEGKLKERVCVLWGAGATMDSARQALAHVDDVPRVPASLANGRLLSCGVKLFMDGSGGARTGWMNEPWLRDNKSIDRKSSGEENRGYPQIDPATYQQMIRLFQQNRVPVGTHAVGDHAMDLVVDTYLAVEKEHPVPGLRHSVIHANLPTPHALEVLSTLQKSYDAGYPEAQAEFLWWIGDNYAGNYGTARDQQLIPLHTFQTRGLLWSGGSDYPVTPLPARFGLWASVARHTAKGTFGDQPFGTAELVDSHTALRSYTAWAARQLFLEDKIGTLEVGKRADIAVWDRDLYTVPPDQIKDAKCVLTLLDGEVVYSASMLAQPGNNAH